MTQIRIDLGQGERGERRRIALEQIATERGFAWNNKPSIGRLIVAMADEQIAQDEPLKTVWAVDGSAVKIYGSHSPHPIIASSIVVAHFGDAETTFHEMHRLRREGWLPRPQASERHPYRMTDVALALENEEHQKRIWRWGTLYPSANEYIFGYYWIDGDCAVFRDGTRVEGQ